MRVLAAILAATCLSSVAWAQDDGRSIAPAATAATTPEPVLKKSKVAEKPAPATKPATLAPGPKASAANSAPENKKVAARPSTTGSAPINTPPRPSGLQETYAAIPLPDRIAIQNDLTWGGDYAGPIDGAFSEQLVAAVKAYQTRHKHPATGVMSEEERAALATAVAPRKQIAGWRLTDDPVTGARVGIPAGLAPKTTTLQNGTRWASEQGQLQIETFRIDTGATIDAVFEQQKKAPRRRVESSSLQGDSFVITGMQGLKKMTVRGYARDGEVRGITILYDQAMEGTGDPLVAPISSAFVPFPGAYITAGAGTPRRKVEYGTGVFVSSAGHVLTDRRLVEGCNIIALPGLGNAERVATDSSGELALLRLYGARGLAPAGLISGALSGNTNVTLIGVADPQAQGGGDAVSSVTAKLGADATNPSLDTPPALGFSGAAALDAQGRLAGMVVMKAPMVAGPGGAPRAAVVPVDRIRNFLEANYVAPSSGSSGADGMKASVTRIICVRK